MPTTRCIPIGKRFADKGMHFISINPQRTRTDDELDAEWVKIVPNTDTALFLAMAYHAYSQNLHDADYLARHTVGADKFIEHLMGTQDGTVKSPEWAAGITGIPAEKNYRNGRAFRQQENPICGRLVAAKGRSW